MLTINNLLLFFLAFSWNANNTSWKSGAARLGNSCAVNLFHAIQISRIIKDNLQQHRVQIYYDRNLIADEVMRRVGKFIVARDWKIWHTINHYLLLAFQVKTDPDILATTVCYTVDTDMALSTSIDFFVNVRYDMRRIVGCADLHSSLGFSSRLLMIFAVIATGCDDSSKNFIVSR